MSNNVVLMNNVKRDELTFESIEKVKISEEYKENEMLIDSIRNFLYEQPNIPIGIIEVLIESIQENTEIEIEYKEGLA